MAATAHVDTFARDRLPPPEAQPDFVFDLPGLQFGERLNCASELLDAHIAAGRAIGQSFREIIGSYNAAMTAIEVTALIEDRAKVEIEATAVIPD